jgi:glycosyltransferase involved in cell wall biosynthesis
VSPESVARTVATGDASVAQPDASIIIASFNQAAFLGEAIESALGQTGCTTEVIVVDDGSTDASAAVAARYPQVVLLRQDRQGACAARNRGMAQSTGRHLVFLDGDDRMLPNAVEIGLQALERSPDCALAYGSFHRISANGAHLSTALLPSTTRDHFAHFLKRNPIVLHSAIFVRQAVAGCGGFVASDWEAADYDLYLRVTRDHPATCHGRVVAERRIHDSQASRANAPMLRAAIRILRRQETRARTRPEWKAAFDAGIRHYQDWFGEHLVTEAHLDRTQRRWWPMLSKLCSLALYYPEGAIAFLRGLRRSATLPFRLESAESSRAPTGEPPGEVASGNSLQLVSLDPVGAMIGTPFPVTLGDRNVLTLACRHASPRTVVIFDGVPLDTHYLDENRLTALVPPEALRDAGDKSVYLLK